MANNLFYVPKLKENNAWLDWRGTYPGGYGWRGDRALSAIRFAVNHHSVTNPSNNAKKDVDTLWSIHKSNGWGGIGYNFVITSETVVGKDGLKYAKVAYVGDIGSIRAHTPNTKGAKGLRAGYGNVDLIAACMIGQLHIKNPTEAQIRSAHWLYREIITQEKGRMPNVTGKINDKLFGHKDFDATACPGNFDFQKKAIVNYVDPPKIVKKTEARTITVPFVKVTKEDPSLPKGETKVLTVGKDGSKVITQEVIYTNGKETSRKTTSEVITVQPINEVTAIGTFVPAPTPLPEPPDYDKENNNLLKQILALLQSLVDKVTNYFK